MLVAGRDAAGNHGRSEIGLGNVSVPDTAVWTDGQCRRVGFHTRESGQHAAHFGLGDRRVPLPKGSSSASPLSTSESGASSTETGGGTAEPGWALVAVSGRTSSSSSSLLMDRRVLGVLDPQ